VQRNRTAYLLRLNTQTYCLPSTDIICLILTFFNARHKQHEKYGI